MPKTHRPAWFAPVVLLVIALAVALAAPAGADSASAARRRRAASRARRAQLAARLDTLRASDHQLEGAVRDLDASIVTQLAGIDAARQAADAADTALRDAERRLAANEADVARRRQVVVDRAVGAYVDSDHGLLFQLTSAKDLTEATRRRSFLEDVVNLDRTLLDRLRASEEDLTLERVARGKARDLASARRRHAEQRLRSLRATRLQQGRLRAALLMRIADYLQESEAQSREEGSLTALINDSEARAAVAPQPGRGSVGRISGRGFIWPAAGRITSPFGMRWGRLHAGIDIGAGYGSPIRAGRDGVVILAGRMGGYGNAVIISHGGGLVTLYGHQSRVVAHTGQHVSRGEVIGYVGATGHATGPHLHFEVRVNGRPTNPRSFL